MQVLSKDSSELLNAPGKFPGPMTEIKFWEAKCMNLESLYEQMKAPTTKNMASILDITDRLVRLVAPSTYSTVAFSALTIQCSGPCCATSWPR